MSETSAYGLSFDDKHYDALQIEMYFIKAGGYDVVEGKPYGKGLFHHIREAQTLLWPEDDHHRWSDLVLKNICEERIVVIQGTKDSSKTHTISKWGLVDYWCFPNETLTLVSSTGLRELKLRIWGDISDLFKRATERFPWLAGRMSNTQTGIFTDVLDEAKDVRDIRKGLIAVPCIGGDEEWIGMDRFIGVKQKRRRILGDELQFMHPMYINVLDVVDKGEFKGVFSGNPIGGNGKALDKIAEPVAGWSSLGEITKTKVWKNKYGGVTINLVGTDSPNFDADKPKHYPYLTDQDDIDKILARNGKDSPQYWTLALGVRKIGADSYRVMPVEIAERCGAFNSAIWAGGARTKVYAIDAGYGGDPCEIVTVEFGEDAAGNSIIEFSATRTIPIRVSADLSAEDQIAYFVRGDAARLAIPDSNIFFDAGMRATLAISMARIISSAVNAVNFGGPATERPVSEDTFVEDPITHEKRLKKCNEQYSKFVTELWYSMREATEAKQVRGLSRPAADEFALRDWRWVPGPIGPRYELETKPEFKAKHQFSPNKADVVSVGLEGARRLGFVIKNQNEPGRANSADDDYLERELAKHREFVKRSQLKYA